MLPGRHLPTMSLNKCPACAQCALLANSAGIGGGPFYVPLLNVVLQFDLKAATALSHTIVGESRMPMLLTCAAHHSVCLRPALVMTAFHGHVHTLRSHIGRGQLCVRPHTDAPRRAGKAAGRF